MTHDICYREILGKRVHRYGVSASYGLDEAGVREADDRKRAGRLAAEGPLDFFMIRYNAAHPGAEMARMRALGNAVHG